MVTYQYFKTFLLFLFVFFAHFIRAQHKTGLLKKIEEKQTEKCFYPEIFRNPAMMSGFRKFKNSNLIVLYRHRNQSIYDRQNPMPKTNWKVEANSYFPIDSLYTVWGSASFARRRKNDIKWNESVDYNAVYPYLTATAVGGKRYTENYTFSGGIARKLAKIFIGTGMSYKANLTYRKKDPRIKNIASHLKIKLGVVSAHISRFSLGFLLGGEKYTQFNNIKFFNELGNPPIYHLNGLGHFNQIFKGKKTDVVYEGLGYKAAIQVVNRPEKKYVLHVSLKKTSTDKTITHIQNSRISELKNTVSKLFFTRMFRKKNIVFGIKSAYIFQHKKGIESVFSGRSATQYAIYTTQKYTLKNNKYSLSFWYSQKKANNFFKISPSFFYSTHKEDYHQPKSYQYFNYLSFGIDASYLKKIKKSAYLSMKPAFFYQHTLKTQSLFGDTQERIINDMLKANFMYFGLHFFSAHLNITLGKQLTNRYNLILRLDTEGVFFSNGAQNFGNSLSLGLNF